MSLSDSRSPSPSSSSPRKRPRTDATSEERKEARAHRNRIAAQNSRDRRKAQFAYLEQRVAELEEENRILRARRGVPLPHERENEELRERIKTLERGWDAVVKALAAQGLPLVAPPTPPPPAPVFPISPAPSHSSLDSPESTRHLARVASIGSPMALQRVNSSISHQPTPSTMTQPCKTSSWKSSLLPSLPTQRPRVLLQRPPRGLPRKRPGASRRRLRRVLTRQK
ncbi:hypothetical protein H2248_005336 [Termitomyces sp. 'cryptogamus']|nr:hypothetical protein H2248_005336 [Termitomyces sp. 'cryptogamus']